MNRPSRRPRPGRVLATMVATLFLVPLGGVPSLAVPETADLAPERTTAHPALEGEWGPAWKCWIKIPLFC